MGLIDKVVTMFKRSETPAPAPGADGRRQGTGAITFVSTFLTSPETNSKLSNPTQRFKTYDSMSLNVAIVATSLRYISALISSTNWNLQPPPAKPKESERQTSSDVDDPVGALTEAEAKKAKEYANYIVHMMKLMETPWFKVVRNASQFKWKGFCVLEMIAQRMDEVAPGFIGIACVEQRPQSTIEEWKLEDQSNEVEAFGQRDPNSGETYWIDRDKCIYINDDTLTNQPDGIGLLRHVVELCDQLKRLEQLEGWAYETDLRGIPIGRAPTAILDDLVAKNRITAADRDAKLEGIKNFITNHMKNPNLGLLLDSSPYSGQDATRTPSMQRMWDLELAKGSGTGLAEIHVAIERKQHEIARALGTEQFMLGAGGKGSLALSEDKARALVELINSIIMEIAWCLQRDFIKKIFLLNRWDLKLMPELLPDAAALRSVTTIVDALSKMALAGAVLDRNDPVINQVRGMMKLVKQPFVTEEMKLAGKPANDGGTPGEKGPNAPKPAKDSKVKPPKD